MANIRSLLPKAYLFARQDRKALRRTKRWWDATRCICCRPWVLDPDRNVPLSKRRYFGMRLHALEWLHMLSPLDPRLRGPLAVVEEPERFVDGVEIDVAGDERALFELLDRLGRRAEPLDEHRRYLIESFEPIEIVLRRHAPPAGGCDAAELRALLQAWYPEGSEMF